jgi:hypothetical protein
LIEKNGCSMGVSTESETTGATSIVEKIPMNALNRRLRFCIKRGFGFSQQK